MSFEYPSFDCGTVEFAIVNQDESAIDSSVFTATLSAVSGSTQTLSTFTQDSLKATTYNLRVKAWFTNYNTNIVSKDFTIVIQDTCESPTLTAASLPNVVYYVNSGNVELAPFSDFLDSPVYCPITYASSFSPALPGTTTITLDQATRVYTVFSDNFADVAVYTVTTKSLTPLGAETGHSFSFNVDVQDPCAVATLTIDPSTLTANPFTYLIGAAGDE